MKKFILVILVLLFINSPIIYAQSNSFTLTKTSNQYNAFGTVSINKSGNNYSYSAVVKDLPATLPNNGVYYLLWGLTKEGRADNLGPITNNSEIKGALNQQVTQFFITSEKERYPEYVSGPRIVQTTNIPAEVFSGTIATATPQASPSGSASPLPIGGPTGAPETGLGGAIIWNGLIISMGAIGATGITLNLKKRFFPHR